MVIACALPVSRSLAETFTMPLASMENVTSICGTPRGARRMPVSWKRPSSLFWRAIGRSPCKTWISTDDWKLEAVVKIWLLRMGSVVLRSMTRVQTPPSVSMPSDSGVTSSSRRPFTLPDRTPACKHAPMATHSSGLMPLNGREPVIGLHQILHGGDAARAADHQDLADLRDGDAGVVDGLIDRLARGLHELVGQVVEFARVSGMSMCSGPCLPTAMYGSSTSRLRHGRQLDLGLFGGLAHALHGGGVARQVDLLLAS